MTMGHQTAIASWRARIGLSQRAAAEALGMSLSGYQEQERGAGFDGRPREAPRVLLLACAALEQGLGPVQHHGRALCRGQVVAGRHGQQVAHQLGEAQAGGVADRGLDESAAHSAMAK